MYSVLNTLSEYTYFYILKNITSYTFLLAFKIVESLQCTLQIGDENVWSIENLPIFLQDMCDKGLIELVDDS